MRVNSGMDTLLRSQKRVHPAENTAHQYAAMLRRVLLEQAHLQLETRSQAPTLESHQ